MEKYGSQQTHQASPILVLLPYPSLSGLELFGIRFSAHLSMSGYRPLIACPPASLIEKSARERGLETRPLMFGSRWNILRQQQMTRIVREASPQMAIGFRAHILATFHLSRVMTGRHIPIHLFYRLGAGNIRRIDPFHRFLFTRTATVITNARHVQKKILDYWSIAPEKVICIPSGIDTKKYKPDPDRRSELRGRLGLSDDDVLIGNTGRIMADKGSEDLLDAVLGSNPEAHRGKVHLVFVGREGSPGFIDLLKSKAVAHGRAGQLHFLPFTPSIEGIYPGFDLFVLPVRSHETYAYVVLEAMASGVPVLVPATGGMIEMYQHGREGRFYRHRDRDSLRKELGILLSMTPAERAEMGRAARFHVVQQADWNLMMNRYSEVLGLE